MGARSDHEGADGRRLAVEMRRLGGEGGYVSCEEAVVGEERVGSRRAKRVAWVPRRWLVPR